MKQTEKAAANEIMKHKSPEFFSHPTKAPADSQLINIIYSQNAAVCYCCTQKNDWDKFK